MERMTKWVDFTDKVRYGHCSDGHCGNSRCGNCDFLPKALTRLAEYEDSGLTPDEVVRMKNDSMQKPLTLGEIKGCVENVVYLETHCCCAQIEPCQMIELDTAREIAAIVFFGISAVKEYPLKGIGGYNIGWRLWRTIPRNEDRDASDWENYTDANH